MIQDIMAGIGVQMLLMFSCGLVVGMLLGSGHTGGKIVERLQKADADGKSLKDALKELTDEDDNESGVDDGSNS